MFGASGHGKVVADILLASGVGELEGFIDDAERLWGTRVLNLPVCGGSEWLRQRAVETQIGVALGIGDNRIRRLVAERCVAMGGQLMGAVHPAATVARSARLGVGTVVMAGACVNPDARVGGGVIVNTGAVVEHDVEVGDYAHLSPNAALGGGAVLGAMSHLGLGAVVLPMVKVGEQTVVGAGAVVVNDLPDQVVAFGVPARVHRQA